MKKALALALASLMLIAATAGCTQKPADTSSTGNGGTTTTETTAPAGNEPAGNEPAGTEPAASDGKIYEFTTTQASSPETIDPNLNSSVDGATYIVHMFEGLFRYKWDGTGVEPGVAESWETSADGLTWTFHLRDTAKWSDGKDVVAGDFVYAWKRLVNPETAAPYGYDMGVFLKNGGAINNGEMSVDTLGVKAIDDRTLEVQLENPCPFFDWIAAFPSFMPLRQDTIEANGDNWVKGGDTYISNGPHRMVSFALDDRMVTELNPYYWDKDSVTAQKLTWLFMADDKAQLAALRSGEVVYADAFPQEERSGVQADGTYRVVPYIGTYYVSYNVVKEPLDNPLVRKALTLAIDTDFIANTLRQGSVFPAEAFVGDGFRTAGASADFREDGWKTYVAPADYAANKEEAKKALAEAGYPDGAGFPKIEYLLNDNTGHIMIAEAIQNMWKEVLGVNMEIRVAEWATVTADRREGNFQIARNGWIGDYNDPATLLNLFLSSSGNNDGQYKNPAYDAKMDESYKATDPATRNKLMHEAEDILFSDWACAPIYYYTHEYVQSPKLKDAYVANFGYTLLLNAYVEE